MQQCLNGVVVGTLAFHAGNPGSIPPLDRQTFNIPFYPSHPSGVTKPSSLKLATSGITHPSDAQRGVINHIKGTLFENDSMTDINYPELLTAFYHYIIYMHINKAYKN